MDSLNTILNSGTYGENVSRHNDNNSKIKQAITTLENVAIANKGYFDTLASLQAAFPSPKAGNIAYVANVASSTGYYIYNVVSGVWTATTTEAPAVDVAINNYAQHGYASNPKTLKQVDDRVVQLANALQLDAVKIGTQVWSSKNYSETTTVMGTVIPEITNATDWANATTPAWCYYNFDSANNDAHGKLYNQYAVNLINNDITTYNAANPNKKYEWKVPSRSDFATLKTYLGTGGGGKLKSLTGWKAPNTGATNSTGLNVLPSGAMAVNGDFIYGPGNDSYAIYHASDYFANGGFVIQYNNAETTTFGAILVVSEKLGASIRLLSTRKAGYYDGKKYSALGDSITRGFIPRNVPEYPGKLDSYATVMAKALGMKLQNDTFNLLSVDGRTVGTGSIGDESSYPLCYQYDEAPLDSDVITVMIGTNDARANRPIGTMTSNETTFMGAYKMMCQGLYDRFIVNQGADVGNKKEIILITPIKMLDEAAGIPHALLQSYIDAIHEIGDYFSFPVVDMNKESTANPHLSRTLQGYEVGYTAMYNPFIPDGVHPIQQLQTKMAEVLMSNLRNYSIK